MRVYLAMTWPALRRLLADGAVEAPVAYAVTPALREWYVEGDQEELEYAASQHAARASLRRLGDAEPQRRVVLAADVPDPAARPAPELDRAAVRLAEPVALRQVASALVDDEAAEAGVRAAREALPAADAGDPDAAFTVEAVEDHELAWYATQELAHLAEAQ